MRTRQKTVWFIVAVTLLVGLMFAAVDQSQAQATRDGFGPRVARKPLIEHALAPNASWKVYYEGVPEKDQRTFFTLSYLLSRDKARQQADRVLAAEVKALKAEVEALKKLVAPAETKAAPAVDPDPPEDE